MWSRASEDVLYAPYIERQEAEAERSDAFWRTRIPESLIFQGIPGLSREIEEKLSGARPSTLGEARRLSGMTPAALTALYVAVTLHPSNP